MPRPLLLGLVWLVGVVLAVGTGLLAVRLVGDRVGDDPQAVLSLADVASRVSGQPAPSTATPRPTDGPGAPTPTTAPARATAAPRPTARATTSAPGTPTSRPTAARSTTAPPVTTSAPKTFAIQGGTLSVRCRLTAAQLVYAAPAQGWALDQRSVSGPEVEVRFEGPGTRSRLRVTCSSGRPVEVERRVDDSGGGDG